MKKKRKSEAKNKNNRENIQPETSEHKKQLEEKTKEIQKLTEELNKVAEGKYDNIVKETEPKPRSQGLPNIYRNACFTIAPIHALASSLDRSLLVSENNTITQLIAETKECIDGNKNENEVERVMEKIWNYNTEKWPQYTLKEGTCKQHDAIEYMERIVDDSDALTNEFETTFIGTTICTNKECAVISSQHRERNSINEIQSIHGVERIDIQSLIDDHLLKDEIVCPNCNQDAKVNKRVEKAPNTLMVCVARHTEEGEKIESTITNKNKSILIYENDKPVKYAVTGVIIHKGNQGSNGHYVYNHYDGKYWHQIDDQTITALQKPEENSQGTIFILKKMKHEQQQIDPKITPERNEYPREQRKNSPRMKSIPCKFYKYDKCRRGDECLYLHYTCKDFQQGKCPYNDYCKFRHAPSKPTRPTYQNPRQY